MENKVILFSFSIHQFVENVKSSFEDRGGGNFLLLHFI
jgi:hypothetical protein